MHKYSVHEAKLGLLMLARLENEHLACSNLRWRFPHKVRTYVLPNLSEKHAINFKTLFAFYSNGNLSWLAVAGWLLFGARKPE